MQIFNRKTITRHIERGMTPDQAKLDILHEWAKNIKNGQLAGQKEIALAGEFKQKILVEVLGYTPSSQSGEWTVDVETQIGGGRVDLGLGKFTPNDKNIIAPFELKGADTKDLDAIMSGAGQKPGRPGMGICGKQYRHQMGAGFQLS